YTLFPDTWHILSREAHSVLYYSVKDDKFELFKTLFHILPTDNKEIYLLEILLLKNSKYKSYIKLNTTPDEYKNIKTKLKDKKEEAIKALLLEIPNKIKRQNLLNKLLTSNKTINKSSSEENKTDNETIINTKIIEKGMLKLKLKNENNTEIEILDYDNIIPDETDSNRITIKKWKKLENKDIDCPICLEPLIIEKIDDFKKLNFNDENELSQFITNNTKVILNCGHIFHERCVTCPIPICNEKKSITKESITCPICNEKNSITYQRKRLLGGKSKLKVKKTHK
ncbi:hypothetical protein EBV26_17090, partial [bacterium]|nr:hypothetical protein [bacterium]